jgi:hypothetical protein
VKWFYNKKSGKIQKLLYLLPVLILAIAGGLISWHWLTNFKLPVPAITDVVVPTPEPDKRARLMVVGDMLIHDDVYDDFRIGNTDTFDFRPAFTNVKPIISQGDFNIVNEETILGGVELGLSGLYIANSPQELGDAFIDTGFNIIQLANNHAFDRGLEGMTNTLAFWGKHQAEAITSGVYDSQEARDKTPIIEKNGIKLAFLSYTFGSNLGTGPNAYNLNLINREVIQADVIKAQAEADVIVVGLHWGIEKVREPSTEQRSLAQFLADIGVDIIYGTHPHVLQPPEWIIGTNGQKTFVMYSLGNFLSIHTEDPLYTLTGAIMGLDIVKTTEGEIVLENPFTILTWNYFTPQETNFKVMPFDTVTQADFWWGDWASHKTDMENFIRQKMPDLQVLGLKDF